MKVDFLSAFTSRPILTDSKQPSSPIKKPEYFTVRSPAEIADMYFDPRDILSQPQVGTPTRSSNETVESSIVPRTTPASTATDGQLESNEEPSLVLLSGWKTPLQGGSASIEDLRRVLSQAAQPKETVSPTPGQAIWGPVKFLMSIAEARKELGLEKQIPSKNKLLCPGFPRNCFFYYAFDGEFEGNFNRLYLVVDSADQLVTVQLVDETPEESRRIPNATYKWHTFNFINYRTKALAEMIIDHKVTTPREFGSSRMSTVSSSVLQVDSILYSPNRQKILEEIRWYVPVEFAELVLYCIKLHQDRHGQKFD